MESVLAAVRVAPSKTEIREFPMPDIPADGALLKMEVAGICGTDVRLYREPPSSAPVIMGHENIGYIAKTGSEFTRRQGFKEGDLVFLESTTSPAANASGVIWANTVIAKTPTGVTTRTPSVMAIPRPRWPPIYGAALLNTYTFRGTPSFTVCRRA